MNLHDAADLARKLIHEWLGPQWTFTWSRSRTVLGDCSHLTRTIRLSAHYTALNSRERVENTIRHEIAHALGPREDGHGPNWKHNARRVGAVPVRCASKVDMDLVRPTAKYEATCPQCKQIYKRHRWTAAMGKQPACSLCCKKYNWGRWDARFVLAYRQMR